ncbi:hypothetical protein IWX50DRAFT_636841, partial [Phyllosticta citricarpa]
MDVCMYVCMCTGRAAAALPPLYSVRRWMAWHGMGIAVGRRKKWAKAKQARRPGAAVPCPIFFTFRYLPLLGRSLWFGCPPLEGPLLISSPLGARFVRKASPTEKQQCPCMDRPSIPPPQPAMDERWRPRNGSLNLSVDHGCRLL